jgi:hypothetical protein
MIRNWSTTVKANNQQNYEIIKLSQKIEGLIETINKLTVGIDLIVENKVIEATKKIPEKINNEIQEKITNEVESNLESFKKIIFLL